jgi:P4 family phage/plasmid primase-like protien
MSSPLQVFLKGYKTKKGEADVSHTTISPCRSYTIVNEAVDRFLTYYAAAIEDGVHLSFTERHVNISPIIIDFDFKQKSPIRLYTIGQIQEIVSIIVEKIKSKLVNPSDENLSCYVLEKPKPRRDQKHEGLYKDGIHLIFPYVVTPPLFQEWLREDCMPIISSVLPIDSFINTIESIYDKNVIKGNWMMYGSKKPDEQFAWKATFKINNGTVEVINDDINNFISLFSIRNKHNETQTTALQNISTRPDDTISQITTVSAFITLSATTRQSEIKVVKDLVGILSNERADSYDTWIRVGWCLYNINHKMVLPKTTFLEDWIEFSKRSQKYKEGECEEQWSTMTVNPNGLSMGSLRMWAKTDDCDQYKHITVNYQDVLIDKCASKTHYDVANLLYELYHETIVCASITGNSWYQYENHRWRKIDAAYKLRIEISQTLYSIFETKIAALKEQIAITHTENDVKLLTTLSSKFTDVCNKLKTSGFKDGVIKECASLFYKQEFIENLDTVKNLLAFENGVYDLDNDKFRPGHPSDYITFSTKYEFATEDDHQVQQDIMKFVASIMPNGPMVQYLLSVSAYFLHGNKYLELLWFFVGNGRNGKGCYCTLLSSSFGDYHYEPDISIVTTTKKCSSAASPEMAKSKGKRLFVASEPDDADKDSKFRVNKLKQLRGNDKVQTRGLYKEPEEFRPQFGMVFQMNDMPDLSKLDEAIEKSLKVVSFPFQFVDVESITQPEYQRAIDTSIKCKFENDVRYRQQFMRILIKVYNMYVKGNKQIDEPDEVKDETKKYMEANNPVAGWMRKTYDFTGDERDKVVTTTLLHLFRNSVEEHRNMTDRKFGKFIGALGLKSKPINGTRYYVGIRSKFVTVEGDELEC